MKTTTTYGLDRETVRSQMIRDLVAAEIEGATKRARKLRDELRAFDLVSEVGSNPANLKGLTE